MLAIEKQPDSSWNQIARRTSWSYLFPISLFLLTWHPFPPRIPNIMWWCSLPGAESKAALGAVSMGLDATLDHYFSHPITHSLPSHPVISSPTMSSSPHRLLQSPPLPSKSYPTYPPKPLYRRTHGPSLIFLSRTFLIPPPIRLPFGSACRRVHLTPSATVNLHWTPAQLPPN